ncbi:MAG: pentapeptide repeat-containing protein, partial [Deltaproteobacteria bacterium]|nr:pentapeptide repeat-containing protein [Deltaproteobacteria bacterium]
MENETLKKILASHALWLRSEGGERADLSHANLRNADLQGADLRHAYLRDTNLRGANLRRAYLQGADLRGADLQGARPYDANLQDANLQDANLQYADLFHADLQGADLYGANLQGADLRYANLQGADLSCIEMNWQSHVLLGEILQRDAVTLEHRSAADAVSKSLNLCWDDFEREFSENQKTWAKTVLVKYKQDGDILPKQLQE